MIKSAISNTVHTPLVSTTSIVAKLAVCAVLLAGVDSAHAAKSDRSDAANQAKLAKLERDWKRLHSRRQIGVLNRLVACREYGQCDGLKIHPTLGAMTSAKLRSKQPSPTARIRTAAADADGSDGGAASLLYGGASSINP
jgi:hypothetical protein